MVTVRGFAGTYSEADILEGVVDEVVWSSSKREGVGEDGADDEGVLRRRAGGWFLRECIPT